MQGKCFYSVVWEYEYYNKSKTVGSESLFRILKSSLWLPTKVINIFSSKHFKTFVLVLRMSARTVVFISARKFDGKDHRWVPFLSFN